jgi:arsenate reductase
MRVLVLCTGNSARSQMAEAFLRSLSAVDIDVSSAGVAPTQVRPEAVLVMQELGIDASGLRSKSVERFMGREFDYVITVCDNAAENCPVFPGKAKRIHWSFEDPAVVKGTEEERLDAFRRVRDQMIKQLSSWAHKRGKR